MRSSDIRTCHIPLCCIYTVLYTCHVLYRVNSGDVQCRPSSVNVGISRFCTEGTCLTGRGHRKETECLSHCTPSHTPFPGRQSSHLYLSLKNSLVVQGGKRVERVQAAEGGGHGCKVSSLHPQSWKGEAAAGDRQAETQQTSLGLGVSKWNCSHWRPALRMSV